jgi:hypothetical protein
MKPDDPRSHPDDSQQQPQIVVDDPEDFAKTRQLRSIFDARDAYVDARREAEERLQAERSFGFPEKNLHIYRHMQDFAMAVEPLARQHETDIWTDKTYRIDSWAYKSDIVSLDAAEAYCKQNRPDLADDMEASSRHVAGKTKSEYRAIWAASDTGVEFDGIEKLINSTPRLRYLQADYSGIGVSAPPQRLSDEAFRDLQKFIDDIGLGFDIQTEQQTKIDESLLEEVDEWRQKNL